MASSFSSSDITPEEYERLVQIRGRKVQLLDEIQTLQDELAEINSRLESVGITDQIPANSKVEANAIKKFNENPKKGLRHLVDAGLVENSPEHVASLLLGRIKKLSGRINKTAIGDFLGEKDDFNLDVLRHFVQLQDFRSLELVQAMRNFLLLFRLPGEAQKIDRIMEHFASQYCKQNPDLFDHADTCYTLCYATIMLNTSLYNPNVKERMNLENFLRITDSLNVSRELITGIYNSIRAESFKFPEEYSNFGNHYATAVFKLAEKQGWLQKQGTRYKKWNRRWFVLSNKCLYYFEFPSSREPKGIIPLLENIRVRVLGSQEMGDSITKRPNAFELYSPSVDVIKACKTDGEGRLVEGQHSAYRMSAPSREDMHSWISAIQRSINKDQSIEEVLERRHRNASGGISLRSVNVNGGNTAGHTM